MNQLPLEILWEILDISMSLCRCEKNELLPLRLVSKSFDAYLKQYILKTIQLEFSRFARGEAAPEMGCLTGVGHLCEALYCDMMVLRDEEELDRLLQVFNSIIQKVPEMTTLLDSLRQYCMSENTFDEKDFRRVMDGVLQRTPNMIRLKLNLPFQVIGRASRTATLLLATTFASTAQRPIEFTPLQTLVIDHVSDSTILDICQNPMDMKNALDTFRSLKNLVLSIKRQENTTALRSLFTNRLWHLIGEARGLETLCIIGWNTKRSASSRRHRAGIHLDDWLMKALPYASLEDNRRLKNLRCVELKRIDIDAVALQLLLEQNCSSLKELYLNEVYLKVFGASDLDKAALWIGHGKAVQKPEGCCWVADMIRDMEGLDLTVLRATGLGYDDFEPDTMHGTQNYDLEDPTGLGRSLDERFVNVATSKLQVLLPGVSVTSPAPDTEMDLVLHDEDEDETPAPVSAVEETDQTIAIVPNPRLRKAEYDVEAYQRRHNTTSHWKRCIDGKFYNHNEKALIELQKIIEVADRGMNLLSDEIDRIHSMSF